MPDRALNSVALLRHPLSPHPPCACLDLHNGIGTVQRKFEEEETEEEMEEGVSFSRILTTAMC